ncbi:MAG TPA: ATP-binding protein [Gemmatimonadales bacterium]
MTSAPTPDLLELFFETTEDYGIILLDADGMVRRWNPAAERLFGFQARDMEGTHGREIFVEPDRRAGVPEVELRTAAALGRAEDERWHLRRDGSRFWAFGIMVALRRQGDLIGFAKVVRDVTERRRLEEAMRESQKLESIGVLAAGVAHDFNNVLTAVIGNLSLARQALTHRGDERIAELLEEAAHASQRAAELVRQLLTYAGKGRRVVKPVDVRRIVRDVLTIVRTSVSPRVVLRADLPERCPTVQADGGQIRQLVFNLVLNAAEAIEDRPGEVDVRVRARDLTEAELGASYHGFALVPGRYLELRVRDNARGMDPETLRQIFDPFFTTKFLGRGLGLAAALGIARSHGGGIAVESAPGSGSTFTVLLPAEPAEEPVLTAAEAVAGAARGEGLVLVVDDEPGIRGLVQRTMESLGYTVILAEHGGQAIEIADRIGDELVIVVLDLVMPVLDGGTTAVWLQARWPELPILVMSGLADDDALRSLGQVRIAGVVPKPFSPEQLAQSVAVALRRSAT